MRVSNFGLWKSANAVVIMYDVTSMVSFQNCDIWISAVRLSAPANILATVVANKIDRDAERMVSEEEGKLFAENHNLDYFETSAATHVGINKLFESVAARLLALEQDDKPPNQASTS